MKKFKFLLAAAMCIPSIMRADYKLVVELTNGDTHEYTMKDKPVVGVSSEGVTVTSQGVTSIYPKNEFARFTFDEITIESSVAEVTTNVGFRFIDQNTVVVALESDANNDVLLYDMSGRMLKKVTAIDGKATISLEDHQPGIYILYTQNRSIKITKR